jgi:hypothetical protein
VDLNYINENNPYVSSLSVILEGENSLQTCTERSRSMSQIF